MKHHFTQYSDMMRKCTVRRGQLMKGIWYIMVLFSSISIILVNVVQL
ncbi:hypothetical protein APHWI1_0184 [Anaplasma phagocytophilum str. ApWI1]|uniref:Uncharacterized protein n=2 Tax=Anaplasma phagocytophilum TaxID=948 RepID=A0A0F3N9D3_ANAPH|nr:hypothetical protein APHWEB_1329 [Anaplasma phagocytophilum str. Webster]KJV63539.1 hypothetical protein EPHNCH_0995 [Anaplasma phagocytophilum str. NCH-1]KJV82382.1 hypothetical protein APHHGE2_0982 [Anaplasma phagocytophilum str. HGE2]KJV85582.1 hypothetical protein APHWI1_0184 [Anaplasma phagocytophilum str. ApWI1]KJV87380.1 hypothetical protein APHNYW_0693 [Anaplasma phagocytophilum str. ApNYW]KJV98823.1 hypothetical protein OTSANNIE_0954 [Anaplasma phagocytophilum str. Annie]